ncbi:non-structural maintenance of chromosomes element 3 homolog isoform X1 [Hetaerina americana]|uniref:non-structural maintenance of chromosomes element 3 homolog isoform X1 n=1 Tax=Hetaerina americana TaxID=62018 RepID=UPI003A7F4E8F
MAESQATESVLSPDELNSLVNDTVLYILHDEKCLNLIKRQDIVKYILKEKKKHFPTVIERVKTLLLETLNLELVAIDQNKQYALINRLRSKSNTFSAELEADRTLLIIVLTMIFMNNGTMTECTLFEVLRHLKILSSKQIKKHDYFGDVEAAIKKKYVRWAYLDYDVIPGTDPVEYEFKWGKRATEEISKKEILEFACKVNGDTEPAFWEKQYEEAMKQAAERST